MPIPTCDERQIERLLTDDMSHAERQSAEAHLDTCESCRTRLLALVASPELWGEVRSILSDASLTIDPAASDADPFPARIDARMILNWLGPTDDPEMIGRLGPYEIQGMIGSGGMGVVLKGWDRALRRFVAIKLLAPHLASSEAARHRFLRESRAAAAVVHENVVAIHGVAESEGLPYFVMPYSRGESLQKRLDRVGHLAVEEILRIALQTARGLAAAHAQGLVHRDVKPANILLDEGVERVLLTDFGLARAVDDATLTRSGVIAGTPQYMSPEQIRAESVDTRSDLFSLGATIYAMCTGHAPFRAESTYAILRQITDVDPPPIADFNPAIPEWLCQIVARLMAKHPGDRFANARELADLLEACLANLERSPAMPLSESDFESYGIVTIVVDDFEDDAEIWPGKLLDHLAGAYSGRIRGFVRSSGGKAVGMITLMTLALAGLVIGTEAPDVAGTWHGEDWGTVKLESKAPGTLEGTFEDTVNGQPGQLKLQWSRVERRFVGDWREGDDRFGKISVRLDGDAIRGAITTDPASKVNPGTPQLADLAWFRHDASRKPGESFTYRGSGSEYRIMADKSIDFTATRESDRKPLQGKWEVVEARIRGRNDGAVFPNDTVELKSVDFQGGSLTLEAVVSEDSKKSEIRWSGEYDLIIVDEIGGDIVKGRLLLSNPPGAISRRMKESDFQVQRDFLELKLDPVDSDGPDVKREYVLRFVPKPGQTKITTDPSTRVGAVARERLLLNKTRRPFTLNERFDSFKGQLAGETDVATITGVQVNPKPADVAIVEGVTITGDAREKLTARSIAPRYRTESGQQAKAVTLPQFTANIAAVEAGSDTVTIGFSAEEPGSEKTAANSPDAKQSLSAATRRFGQSRVGAFPGVRQPFGGLAATSNLPRGTDVLFVGVPSQFPEDYSVVHSQTVRTSKPALTLKARWAEGDTETIRTINVALSEESSTAIVRLEPIQSVELFDGKNAIKMGDPKSGVKFSLMQFELLPDNVVQIKCWAVKGQKADAAALPNPDLPAASIPSFPATDVKITSGASAAKAVTGVTIESNASLAPATTAKPPKSDQTAPSEPSSASADSKPVEETKKP